MLPAVSLALLLALLPASQLAVLPALCLSSSAPPPAAPPNVISSCLVLPPPAHPHPPGMIRKRQFGDMGEVSWLRRAAKEVARQDLAMRAAIGHANGAGGAGGAAVQVQAYQVPAAAGCLV